LFCINYLNINFHFFYGRYNILLKYNYCVRNHSYLTSWSTEQLWNRQVNNPHERFVWILWGLVFCLDQGTARGLKTQIRSPHSQQFGPCTVDNMHTTLLLLLLLSGIRASRVCEACTDINTDRTLALSAIIGRWPYDTDTGKPSIDAGSSDGTPAPGVTARDERRPYLIEVGTTRLRAAWVRSPIRWGVFYCSIVPVPQPTRFSWGRLLRFGGHPPQVRCTTVRPQALRDRSSNGGRPLSRGTVWV